MKLLFLSPYNISCNSSKQCNQTTKGRVPKRQLASVSQLPSSLPRISTVVSGAGRKRQELPVPRDEEDDEEEESSSLTGGVYEVLVETLMLFGTSLFLAGTYSVVLGRQ